MRSLNRSIIFNQIVCAYLFISDYLLCLTFVFACVCLEISDIFHVYHDFIKFKCVCFHYFNIINVSTWICFIYVCEIPL